MTHTAVGKTVFVSWKYCMFVLNLTISLAVFALRYPVNANCMSAASPITDIMKCHTALRSHCLLSEKADPQTVWAVELSTVEFDSGLMRTDPKSSSQYRQKLELGNEGKPIWPKFFSVWRRGILSNIATGLFFMENSENHEVCFRGHLHNRPWWSCQL